MATPTPSPTPEQLQYILSYKKLDIISDAVNLMIPWGSLVLIFVFLYMMVARLSGKVTLAQVGIAFMGELRLSDAVAYLFGGVGTFYGFRERRLRHKKTEGLASYAAQLESKLDPNRTSSGLTPQGTTQPERKVI